MSASVSLFSGAGGLDLGLEQAGLTFRAWVEQDAAARCTLRANFPRAERAALGDIRAVDPAYLLRAAGLQRGEAFAVSGGPPCQAFSSIGRRRSLSDPRGALVTSYLDFLVHVEPRFFVFENVAGLGWARIAAGPSPASTTRAANVLADLLLPGLRSIGYEVVAGRVDAVDYGVPQRRQRIIVLGSRGREFRASEFLRRTGRELTLADLMPPTHHGSPRTLRDGLSGMPDEPPEFSPYSEAMRRVFELIPAGANWTFLRDRGDGVHHAALADAMGGALADGRGGKTSFWRRLAWDEPCTTVVGRPNQRATGLCHPEETRPLSFQEYRRVQAFPDTFRVIGTTAMKYRQVGNAVPPPIGQAAGAALMRAAAGRPGSVAIAYERYAAAGAKRREAALA